MPSIEKEENIHIPCAIHIVKFIIFIDNPITIFYIQFYDLDAFKPIF